MKKYWIILLLSTSAFASSILVRWTPSTTPTVDHYRVMRSLTPGGPYVLLGNVAATSSQFTNGSNPDGTALVAGQQYCYIVVAVAGLSVSSNSNESCTQIQLIQPATNVQAFPQP